MVYRADHPQHGTVAVKVLREKLRNDRTAVARFLREASYGTRVLHPNVVRTIEIGEIRPGVHFLSTEWATGELLEKYAKRNAPLPPADVADIIRQSAAAVNAGRRRRGRLGGEVGVPSGVDIVRREYARRGGFVALRAAAGETRRA